MTTAHSKTVEKRTHLPSPILATVEMGYGHLRAAWALADRCGIPVTRVDLPPIASRSEERLWVRSRLAYEQLSRFSQKPFAGLPFRWLLDRMTRIRPIGSPGFEESTGLAVRHLSRLIDRGLGAGLARRLATTGHDLLSTFYAPALAADRLTDSQVFCVVTDTDIHRIWAPIDPRASRIHYLVPTTIAAHRLRSYGIRAERISITGFPLPANLEDEASRFFTDRVSRLQSAPASVRSAPDVPLLTFAVGGAGAQTDRARQILHELADPVRSGSLRLALVAGTHRGLAARFRSWCGREIGARAERAVEIVEGADFGAYYRSFNALLERTDVLWTKPSELVFYAALGLPLILDDPVGAHERANRRWVLDARAGVDRPPARRIAETISSWLANGTLADCARAGFESLPRGGTRRIAESSSIPLYKDLTVS